MASQAFVAGQVLIAAADFHYACRRNTGCARGFWARTRLLLTVVEESISEFPPAPQLSDKQCLTFIVVVCTVVLMRTPTYYLVRTYVRILFWGTLAFGLVWLAVSSVNAWDDYTCVETDVVAEPYDTMWGIAVEYCDGNIESAVNDLVLRHGSATVRVGQTIEVRNK